MKKITGYLIAFFISGLIIQDALNLALVCSDKYGTSTPWYKIDWILHPVQNTIFLFIPFHERWTTNYLQTELWLVREVNFAGKEFWTIIEKKQNPKTGN